MMTKATNMPDHEEWLTVREACELIGVSPATLRRWSDDGHVMAFTTPGGHRRFTRATILELLPTSMNASPATPPNGGRPHSAGRASGAAGSTTAAPASARADSPAAGETPGSDDAEAVVALVTHARQVPSALRETFKDDLAALDPDEATIAVHTCHRVELYVASVDEHERPLPEPPAGARRLEGTDAIRHVIAVACGLDSAVLGENQVLHQLRETLNQRRTEGRLDPALDRLFQIALHAGRRARSWLNGTQRSLADVALERVARRVGELEGKELLIVGAGVMGRLAAFAAARQGAEVIVTSRTDARAIGLARDVGGRAVPFEGENVVPDVAGALVALCGEWRVGEQDGLRLAENGTVVVDMSSPPAVPDRLQGQLGDSFISTDDLAGESGFEPQGRLRERLEQLVEESTDAYCRWLRSRNVLPAIQAIGEAVDEQRRHELEWLFRRIPEMPEKERSLIEQMSNRLVAGILHEPRTALNADESGELGQAARELFGT
jgi:glutamyl-tRNA reductase